MAKQYTFADRYKDLKKQYNKNGRLDKGDPITVKSFNKAAEQLKAEQEAIKAEQQATEQQANPEMQQMQGMDQQSPQPMEFKYGGRMKMVDGGYFFTYQGQSDPKLGRNQQYKSQRVEISASDHAKMAEADKIYKKWKPKLQAAYDKKGSDLTAAEIQAQLGPEAYKDLNKAKSTLSNISNTYDIPANSFGLNEGDFGSSVGDQMFGPRYSSENWTVSDSSGKSILGNQEMPTTAGEYETYQKNIDKYQIDPKYDIAGTVAATRPLLDNFKTDQVQFDRASPGYVNYENSRQQARQDNTVARNVGLQNLNRMGASAGQSAANALALQTGLGSNLNKTLSASQEAEANRNSQLFGQNQAQNANIQRAETVQNYGDRRYVDEAEFNRKAQVGRNINELMQARKRDNMDELGLQLSKPGYQIDSEGNLVATKGYRPVSSEPQSFENFAQKGYDGVTPYGQQPTQFNPLNIKTPNTTTYDGVTPYAGGYDGVSQYENKPYEPSIYKNGGTMNPYRAMALEIIKKKCGGKLK